MRIPPSVSALLIAVVPFGPSLATTFQPNSLAAQDEAAAEAEPLPAKPREFPLNRLKQFTRDRQLNGLEGAWRLYSYQESRNPVSSDEIVGNAIFGGGFMTLVIHATGYDDATGEESDMGQAGIFRFEVNEFSNLQTITILAHASPPSLSPYERVIGLLPEAQGAFREYGLSVQPDRVELRHHTGTRLTFVRMQAAALSPLEIARLGKARTPVIEPTEPEQAVVVPLEEQILGGWYLSGYLIEGAPISLDDLEGSVMFGDGYMGLIIHSFEYVDHNDGLPEEEILNAQAGIYQYRIQDSTLLQTATVIGHANPYEDIDYETTGSLRQYSISIEENELILRSADNTALRFNRIKPRKFTQYEQAQLNLYQSGIFLFEED